MGNASMRTGWKCMQRNDFMSYLELFGSISSSYNWYSHCWVFCFEVDPANEMTTLFWMVEFIKCFGCIHWFVKYLIEKWICRCAKSMKNSFRLENWMRQNAKLIWEFILKSHPKGFSWHGISLFKRLCLHKPPF